MRIAIVGSIISLGAEPSVDVHQNLFLDILVRPIASQVVDLNRYPAISVYLPFDRFCFEIYIMYRDTDVVNQHSFGVIFAIWNSNINKAARFSKAFELRK